MQHQGCVDAVSAKLKVQWTCITATLAFFSSVSLAQGVVAADIEVRPPKDDLQAVITIEGEIKPGDDDKFRSIAAKYSDAIVLLNSEGGAIIPAMDIGRTIKLRGYKTAVYSTSSCASACALIWVSGSRRVIFEGGQVGFHASYLDTDGKRLEKGIGNALVGRYLTQLGYEEKTVIFATLAPPDKILWLNDETVSMSGIDFDTIQDEEPSVPVQVAESKVTVPPRVIVTPPPLVRTVSRPPTESSYQQFMGDAKQTLRSPDVFVQALRQKGFQATISYEDKNMPQITTGVGGEQILISFSGCDQKGCNYIQLIDFVNDATKDDFFRLMSRTSKEEFYSHAIWLDDTNVLAFYNYIVIGADGITTNTLTENMNYFGNYILYVTGDTCQMIRDRPVL